MKLKLNKPNEWGEYEIPKGYQGAPSDIFAMGSILVNMISGKSLIYNEADKNDKFYKFIYQQKGREFIARKFPKIPNNESLINLILSMM